MTALRRSPWTILVVLAVVALAFLAQREIMNRAFDRLEADQVASDAERIRFALDAETRLLTGFGSTNSVWDDSNGDVRRADAAGFAASFPPADLRAVYGVDGILGVGPDGAFRVGGLGGPDGFVAQPPELTEAAALRALFDPGAEPGAGRCGLVATSTVPYLACGFASHDGAGENPFGGLIFLKALDRGTLAAIGKDIELPISVVAQPRPGGQGWPALTSRLGTIEVRTSTLGADRIALSVRVPAAGGSVLLEATRGRPVHATATTVGRQLFGLGVVLGALALLGMGLLVRQGTRAKVRPLLATTEAVIASGDRSLRVRSDDRTEIGALARAIDGMLDSLQQQESSLRTAQEERERELAGSFEERRRLQEESGRAAQQAIGRTVEAVSTELERVSGELESVRQAARTIDARVAATDEATRGVAEEAARADRVTGALSGSLRQVAGIAGLIQGVAEQTRLLALNATIEAARAGEAGRGFTVVASEVKGLADETSRSTDRISETVASLGGDAEAVTMLIQGMVDRITAIGEAAQGLSLVAEEQRMTLERLEHSVADANASVRRLGQ